MSGVSTFITSRWDYRGEEEGTSSVVLGVLATSRGLRLRYYIGSGTRHIRRKGLGLLVSTFTASELCQSKPPKFESPARRRESSVRASASGTHGRDEGSDATGGDPPRRAPRRGRRRHRPHRHRRVQEAPAGPRLGVRPQAGRRRARRRRAREGVGEGHAPRRDRRRGAPHRLRRVVPGPVFPAGGRAAARAHRLRGRGAAAVAPRGLRRPGRRPGGRGRGGEGRAAGAGRRRRVRPAGRAVAGAAAQRRRRAARRGPVRPAGRAGRLGRGRRRRGRRAGRGGARRPRRAPAGPRAERAAAQRDARARLAGRRRLHGEAARAPGGGRGRPRRRRHAAAAVPRQVVAPLERGGPARGVRARARRRARDRHGGVGADPPAGRRRAAGGPPPGARAGRRGGGPPGRRGRGARRRRRAAPRPPGVRVALRGGREPRARPEHARGPDPGLGRAPAPPPPAPVPARAAAAAAARLVAPPPDRVLAAGPARRRRPERLGVEAPGPAAAAAARGRGRAQPRVRGELVQAPAAGHNPRARRVRGLRRGARAEPARRRGLLPDHERGDAVRAAAPRRGRRAGGLAQRAVPDRGRRAADPRPGLPERGRGVHDRRRPRARAAAGRAAALAAGLGPRGAPRPARAAAAAAPPAPVELRRAPPHGRRRAAADLVVDAAGRRGRGALLRRRHVRRHDAAGRRADPQHGLRRGPVLPLRRRAPHARRAAAGQALVRAALQGRALRLRPAADGPAERAAPGDAVRGRPARLLRADVREPAPLLADRAAAGHGRAGRGLRHLRAARARVPGRGQRGLADGRAVGAVHARDGPLPGVLRRAQPALAAVDVPARARRLVPPRRELRDAALLRRLGGDGPRPPHAAVRLHVRRGHGRPHLRLRGRAPGRRGRVRRRVHAHRPARGGRAAELPEHGRPVAAPGAGPDLHRGAGAGHARVPVGLQRRGHVVRVARRRARGGLSAGPGRAAAGRRVALPLLRRAAARAATAAGVRRVRALLAPDGLPPGVPVQRALLAARELGRARRLPELLLAPLRLLGHRRRGLPAVQLRRRPAPDHLPRVGRRGLLGGADDVRRAQVGAGRGAGDPGGVRRRLAPVWSPRPRPRNYHDDVPCTAATLSTAAGITG